jgi:hypothetical protein
MVDSSPEPIAKLHPEPPATRPPRFDDREADPAYDLAGMLEARRALGADAEEAIIASFLQRTGRAIDERVDQRLAEGAPDNARDNGGFWLAMGSIFAGIPVTGVITTLPAVAATVVGSFAWAAIAAVNFAYHRKSKSEGHGEG